MARGGWRDKFYARQDWKRKRARQLAGEPLCAICLAMGKIVPATIADHVVPHRGDLTSFLRGTLQSLCKSCHDRKWADDRRGYSTAIGADGYPIDPNHPFRKGTTT